MFLASGLLMLAGLVIILAVLLAVTVEAAKDGSTAFEGSIAALAIVLMVTGTILRLATVGVHAFLFGP
jgi:hypothetical protein